MTLSIPPNPSLSCLLSPTPSSLAVPSYSPHSFSLFSHFVFIFISLPMNAFGGVFRILGMSTQELQHCFDSELLPDVKELLTYARHLLEFCSYKALHKLSESSDFLNDKEFRRLTFDMMLAWEAPSVYILPVQFLLFSTHSSSFHHHHLIFGALQETPRSTKEETVGEDDDSSLFYTSSTTMALQVSLSHYPML